MPDGEPLAALKLVALACSITLLMSVVTFVLFALDKRAARRQQRRTPERTLHVAELLGGWPGSLLGQRLLHHKRRKRIFVLVSLGCAVVNVAAWTAVIVLRTRS